jgi:NAD(P)-dependent dehydrogenase (short-subunit alcohol dehydrogenase family)
VTVGKLKDKVVIVTGATSGMGWGIAELFAKEGAAVVAGGRNGERGRSLVEKIRAEDGKAEFVAADVGTLEGNQALVRAALEKFGGVDSLVMSAGELGLGSVTDVPLEVWHSTLAANLHAVFYLCRFGIPEMKKRGGGTIVVNGSIAAYKGFPNHAAYCASKGALVPFVKQMARDYGAAIRVNLMCPGPVDTPLIWDSAKAFPNPAKAVQAAADGTVQKRLGLPRDIANLALFLASDESSWMTGAAITIDGGALC